MKGLLVLFGLALGGIVLLVIFYFFNPSNPEPMMFQDKPIEYWFVQMPMTPIPAEDQSFSSQARIYYSGGSQAYGQAEMEADAQKALSSFGTNALPFLMARLQGSDSVAEEKLTSAAINSKFNYVPFRDAESERMQAVTALIQAPWLPPETTALLMSLQTNASPDVAKAAAHVLRMRGSQAQQHSE